MAIHRRHERLIEEYAAKRHLYSDFTDRLVTIIRDILNLKDYSYLSIEGRTKSIESLRQKFSLKKADADNLLELHDLSGVRVITYVYDDIEDIEKILRECFEAEEVEVDERLGTDRVGYRSHHWIISLPKSRLALPEYERFADLKAELQIRTVLQHAWAQIGHNQVYKPSAVLPEKIERDFTLLSGVLEVADNEFNRISKEIQQHQASIEARTQAGDLKIQIDSVSLRQYFNDKFKDLPRVAPIFGPQDDMVEGIIKEFNAMGIETLADLDAIIPENLAESISAYSTNYTGLARRLMVAYDFDTYFTKAWNEQWVMDPANFEAYRKLGVDLEELFAKYPDVNPAPAEIPEEPEI